MGRFEEGGNWRFQAAVVSNTRDVFIWSRDFIFMREKTLGSFEQYLWQPWSNLLG